MVKKIINKSNILTSFGLHAIVWREGKLYVAKTLELEVASQGKTKNEALKNLEEAVELYCEDEKLPMLEIMKEPEIHLIRPNFACFKKDA